MPLVALQTQPHADPFATVRALNRMRRAGFSLTVRADKLVVSPADRLSDEQRAFLKAHRLVLVALLQDAETLHTALVDAAAAGLGWMEGTPADWTGERLLAAGEVLYGSGQMVNYCERRYLKERAPASEWPENVSTEAPEIPDPLANVAPLDREAYEERAAIMEYDGGLPRDVAERRAKELMALGWAPSNVKARAHSEMLPGWESAESEPQIARSRAPKPHPPVCQWDAWGDRLVVKCADPAPNADRTGCANCGSSKP